MAKYRKSNCSKRVSRGCGNNKSCSWCRSDRLHSTKRALDSVESNVDSLVDDLDWYFNCDSEWWMVGDEFADDEMWAIIDAEVERARFRLTLPAHCAKAST